MGDSLRIVARPNQSFIDLFNRQPCFAGLYSELERNLNQQIEGLILQKPEASSLLRRAISPVFAEYKEKVLVVPDLALSNHDANYRMDYLRTFRQSDCGHVHQISFEVCFDNRQAIGTNVLKAHLANNLVSRNSSASAASLLLVSERKIQNEAFDSSIGSEVEYEAALLGAYSEIADSAISLLTLTY